MANKLLGTNLASMAVPFTDADTYPTHSAKYGKGGHQSVDTLSDRNSIYFARRDVGMTCYVLSTDKTYKLVNNPAVDTTQDTDWEVDAPSTDDILLGDGKTSLTTKITNMEALSKRYVLLCIKPVELGPDSNEQIIPFNASIVGMECSVPLSATLTKDLVVSVEKYDGTQWTDTGTMEIRTDNTGKSTELIISDPISISVGDRLRANIISVQDDMVSLTILVSLKLTI